MLRTKTSSCLWCGVAMAARAGKRFCSESHQVMARRAATVVLVERVCLECDRPVGVARRVGRPRLLCGVQCTQARAAKARVDSNVRRYEDFFLRLRLAGLGELDEPGFDFDRPAPKARLGVPDGSRDVDPRFGDWDWPAFVSEFGLCGDEVGQTNAGSPVAAGRVKGAVPAPCVMGLTLGAQ